MPALFGSALATVVSGTGTPVVVTKNVALTENQKLSIDGAILAACPDGNEVVVTVPAGYTIEVRRYT